MDKSSGLKGRPPFPQGTKRFVSSFPSQVGEMKREIERETQLSKRRGLLSRKLRELDLPLPLFPPKLLVQCAARHSRLIVGSGTLHHIAPPAFGVDYVPLWLGQ